MTFPELVAGAMNLPSSCIAALPAASASANVTKPVKFSQTPGPSPVASPAFGQHSDEVLAGYGYSASEIACLRERGILR